MGHDVTTLDPAPLAGADTRSDLSLERKPFSGVLDCTHPPRRPALKRGYNTQAYFVEKPLGNVEQCNKPLMMGFCYYWLPSLRAFVESLQHVRICGMLVSSGQALQSFHGIDYRDRYHGTPGLGGVLNDTISHFLFVARWLLGDLQLKAAVVSKLSGLDIQTEDTAALLLESPQGQPCTIWADYMRRPRATSVSVVTSESIRTWTVDTGELVQMYDEQMRVFCEICEGKRTYGYPRLTDGQAVQRILDAARSGDHTGPHGVNKATG